MSNLTLIGSGNVASHLGNYFIQKGHTLDALYSRNTTEGRALAEKLNCTFTQDLDFTDNIATIFIIAISDRAIEEISSQLKLPAQAILAHTSGSIPLEVLSAHQRHGVFYPIQTFTKDKALANPTFPIGIEGSSNEVANELLTLAKTISPKAAILSSEKRKTIHIAAVFACNFTNHLLSIAERIVQKDNLDFSTLAPLIQETIHKAVEIGPNKAQTGPAIRKDTKIINEHLDYLQKEAELYELYRILTKSIQK